MLCQFQRWNNIYYQRNILQQLFCNNCYNVVTQNKTLQYEETQAGGGKQQKSQVLMDDMCGDKDFIEEGNERYSYEPE